MAKSDPVTVHLFHPHVPMQIAKVCGSLENTGWALTSVAPLRAHMSGWLGNGLTIAVRELRSLQTLELKGKKVQICEDCYDKVADQEEEN